MLRRIHNTKYDKEREREGGGNFYSTTFTDKTLSTYHRVGRELSLFSSRRNWDSPNPSPEGECALLPPISGRRGALAGTRGDGSVQIQTSEHTLWYSLYIRTLWYLYKKDDKERGGRTAISDIWIDFIASFQKNMTIEKGTSKVIYFLEIPMMIYNRESNAGFVKT